MKNIGDLLRRFLQGAQSWLLGYSRILRDESGSALVELALVVSLLFIPILAGTMELGLLVFDSIEVSSSAHAGAMYGMMSATYAADSAGIQRAAQAEASDFGTNLTVTTTVYYACSLAVAGAQYSSQSTANTACTGTSNHALEFVQVFTSTTVTSPIKCPGLPSTAFLTGLSVMEVEE